MTLRVGLTHPALTKLTFMDYLLTMLRNRLRRKLSYDTADCPKHMQSSRRNPTFHTPYYVLAFHLYMFQLH